MRSLLLLFLISLGLFGSTITVGSSIEYGAAFDKICETYEKESGVVCIAVSGPSQKMRQNIQNKAPVDIYFDTAVMGNSVKFAKVSIGVAIFGGGSDMVALKEPKIKKIAILSTPDTEYQKASYQMLKSEAVHDDVLSKCVVADSATVLFDMMEQGRADAAMAPYALLVAQKFKKPSVLIRSKNFNHADFFLAYQRVSQKSEVQGFLKFLRSQKATSILDSYGLAVY